MIYVYSVPVVRFELTKLEIFHIKHTQILIGETGLEKKWISK